MLLKKQVELHWVPEELAIRPFQNSLMVLLVDSTGLQPLPELTVHSWQADSQAAGQQRHYPLALHSKAQ